MKKGPDYLPELINCVSKGIPISQAAAIVGRAPSTCWEALKRHAPDLQRHCKPRVSPDERRKFLSRFESGESILQIATESGRQWRTIERALVSDKPLSPVRCRNCGMLIVTSHCLRCYSGAIRR